MKPKSYLYYISILLIIIFIPIVLFFSIKRYRFYVNTSNTYISGRTFFINGTSKAVYDKITPLIQGEPITSAELEKIKYNVSSIYLALMDLNELNYYRFHLSDYDLMSMFFEKLYQKYYKSNREDEIRINKEDIPKFQLIAEIFKNIYDESSYSISKVRLKYENGKVGDKINMLKKDEWIGMVNKIVETNESLLKELSKYYPKEE